MLFARRHNIRMRYVRLLRDRRIDHTCTIQCAQAPVVGIHHDLERRIISISLRFETTCYLFVFKYIRVQLVCVLVDEVESLTAARKSSMEGNEPSDALRVVNALLTQIDQVRYWPTRRTSASHCVRHTRCECNANIAVAVWKLTDSIQSCW